MMKLASAFVLSLFFVAGLAASDQEECDLCNVVAQKMSDNLHAAANHDLLTKLDAALSFVDVATKDYPQVQAFVEALKQIVDEHPEESCTTIGMCEAEPELDAAAIFDTCKLCDFVLESGISIAEKYLDLDVKIHKIKAVLEEKVDKFCDRTGNVKIASECHDLVQYLTEGLEKLTIAELRELAPEACFLATLCPEKPAPIEIDCNTCTATMEEAAKSLRKEIDDHEATIADAGDKFCEKLPSTFVSSCKVAVPSILQQGELVLDQLPGVICNALHAC